MSNKAPDEIKRSTESTTKHDIRLGLWGRRKMSNTTVSKGKKRAARERLNKFLSVLLSVAMVLQTSPVAYARWDEGGAEGYSYDAAVPEEMTTTSEEVVAEAEPEPQPEPQVEEQAPVDEVANNSSNIVEAPEGTDVAEQDQNIVFG